jgi:predicted transcriptional regulator
MQQLWAAGEASVRTVMDALNGRAPKPRAYTTYMTVMARLDTKGLLHRRREGKTDYYAPVHGREEYMALRLTPDRSRRHGGGGSSSRLYDVA